LILLRIPRTSRRLWFGFGYHPQKNTATRRG
jgi:hypothetical protein